MLSRARLILLSGIAGAGTTTITAATAAALQAEGLRVEVIDASESLSPDQSVIAAISLSVGGVFAEVGADPVLAEAWTSLPGVAHLSSLARIVAALDDASIDVVVVDAGDHRRARGLVDLPATLLRLLDAALTPRLAMLRPSGGAGASDEAPLFETLSASRAAVLRMSTALAHPATTIRLVTPAEQGPADRTERAAAAFAMLGVGVDGIIVNRFPRKADGASTGAVVRAKEIRDGLASRLDGVAVWSSTAKLRPVPKGRSALGPLARVSVLDAEQLTVHVGEEEYSLELALAPAARAAATVGKQADRRFVAFDGAIRWIDLPPVLRRCIATYADRTSTGLRVAFVPDPAVWREPAVNA